MKFEQVQMMVCLNRFCDEIIPEYRLKRIEPHISNWNFCVSCVKNNHLGSPPLEYVCRRDDCDKIVTYQKNRSRAYCSDICARRNHQGVKVSEMRTCQNCTNLFMSTLGYIHKFCGDECRKEFHKIHRKPNNFMSLQDCILMLLYRGDSNIQRLAKFIKKDIRHTKQIIRKLRSNGHDITLTSNNERYHLNV